MSVNTDEMILNCYRLAERYHQSPEVFLAMPYFSRVQQHIHYTWRLIEIQNRLRRKDGEQ